MTKTRSNNSIRYLIIAFFAIILVPIAINYLLPLTIPGIIILGTENNWFSFWSSYSGAIISGLITLFVLYKTLLQNQQNHINQINKSEQLNRDQISFQSNLLLYQENQKFLSELKIQLNENVDTLDYNTLSIFQSRISFHRSNNELIKEILDYIKKVERIQINISILYKGIIKTEAQQNYINYSLEVSELLNSILINELDILIEFEKLMDERNSIKDNLRDGFSNIDQSELMQLEEMVKVEYEKGTDAIQANRKEMKKEYDLSMQLLIKATVNLISSEEKIIQNELKDYYRMSTNTVH